MNYYGTFTFDNEGNLKRDDPESRLKCYEIFESIKSLAEQYENVYIDPKQEDLENWTIIQETLNMSKNILQEHYMGWTAEILELFKIIQRNLRAGLKIIKKYEV
jgi:hypothetical protein